MSTNPDSRVGLGRDEAEAIRIMDVQKQELRRRGLWATWVVYRKPLNQTRDGHDNTLGPWGVFISKRST